MQRQRQRRMRSDHLRGEAAYLPDTLEELERLRQRVIAAGHPAQTASGIVGWLLAKAHGAEDWTSSPTRSRYRKILADLGVPTGHGPESGRARRAVMPAVTGAGAAAALVGAGSTVGAVVALAAGLYVTRSGGEELELEVAA